MFVFVCVAFCLFILSIFSLFLRLLYALSFRTQTRHCTPKTSHHPQQLLQLCVLPFRPTPAACFPTPALALITARNHVAVARQRLAAQLSALTLPSHASSLDLSSLDASSVNASSADTSSSALSVSSSSSSSTLPSSSSSSVPVAAAAVYLVDFESRRATAAAVASRLLWAALHLWRMPLSDKLLAWVLRAHAAVDNASAVAAAAAEAKAQAAARSAADGGGAAAAANAQAGSSDAKSTRAPSSSSAKDYASSSSHAIDAWLREARRRRLVPTVALFDRLVDVVTHAAILGTLQCRRVEFDGSHHPITNRLSKKYFVLHHTENQILVESVRDIVTESS